MAHGGARSLERRPHHLLSKEMPCNTRSAAGQDVACTAEATNSTTKATRPPWWLLVCRYRSSESRNAEWPEPRWANSVHRVFTNSRCFPLHQSSHATHSSYESTCIPRNPDHIDILPDSLHLLGDISRSYRWQNPGMLHEAISQLLHSLEQGGPRWCPSTAAPNGCLSLDEYASGRLT